MSEIVQCLIDSGIAPKDMDQYLPTGQKLTRENVDEAIEAFKRDQSRKSVTRLQAEAANIRIAEKVQRMMDDKSAGGEDMKPREAVKALLVRDLRDRSETVSVEGLVKGYSARIGMPLARAAEMLRPSVTGGFRNKDFMQDVFRVAGGGKATSNEVAQVGAALRESLELAHKLVREAGGDIGYIENYLPQTHVAGKIRTAGKDAWINDVFKRLDRTKMLDPHGRQLTDEDLLDPEEGLLPYIYATITTEGRNKIAAPASLPTAGKMNVSAKSSLERILHFTDVDAALWYNSKYGNEDLWGTYTNHLHSLATDAAVYKTFSAAPDLVYGNWRDWAVKADSLNDMTEIDHIWRNIIGFDHNGETPILQIANAARDTLSSAFMGSAILASVPDVMLVAMNASMNGMNVPRMLATMRHYSKSEGRELLSRTAGNMEYAVSTMSASLRFEDTIGRGLSHRLSDGVYRLSGMTGWMNSLRHAWLTEFQTFIGANLDKSVDQLPRELQGWLSTYGLTKRWDDIRKMSTQDFHGARVADFSSLDDDDLIAELLGAVYTERDLAVLHPDARTRALLNQGKAPGGMAGEMLRSATQFKTFAASVIMHGVWRYAFSKRLGSAGNRAAWSMSLLMGMAAMGGVAYQLRELAKGRDPVRMDTKDFFLRAIAQGGAVPGLAELFLDGETRHGQNWLEATLGPTGSAVSTLASGAWNGAGALLGVDEASDKFFREVESASYMIPGSNMWYARAGVQRLMRDTLLDMADPNYSQRKNEAERNRRNEFDQDAWWGFQDEPRMPDFGAAMGEL